MKKLLLLILFLFPKTVFSQTDFTKIYHPIINEAELAIVEDNHAEALSLYKEAFLLVEKPFAKDYYNAAVCAVFTNRLSLAFEFLEKIVEKGYPVDSLRKDKFFKSVADTSKRWNVFEKQAKLIKPTINIELRDSLQKLLEMREKSIVLHDLSFLDNKVILKMDGKIVIDTVIVDKTRRQGVVDSVLKGRSAKSNIIRKDFNEKLDNFLTINGFPDENMIGLIQFEIKRKQVIPSFYTINPYFENTISLEVFRFNSGNKNTLLQALKEGKILPSHVKSLFSDSPENNFLNQDYISVFQIRTENNLICESDFLKEKIDKWFWKKNTPAEMSETELNEKRMNLGLEKIEDNFRKIFFKATYPKTPFIIHSGGYRQELFYVATCETAEKVLRESVELK